MNQSRSSLITSFFKSPAAVSSSHGALGGEEQLGAASCDDEESRSSEGGGSEGGGGEGGVKFAINLNGLLSSSQTTLNFTRPQVNSSSSGMENEALPVSTVSSGMRRGPLMWDTSSGTLSLKPSVSTTIQTSPPTALVLPSPHSTLAQSPHPISPPSPPATTDSSDRGEAREVGENRAVKVGVAPEGSRRTGQRSCREVVDYCENGSCSERDGGRRKRRRKGVAAGSSKRRRRREVELIVKVERSLLCRVPGQDKPSELESVSDVEMTLSVEGDLDKSVVLLSTSPPPPPSSSSATLSGSWAKIFSRPTARLTSSSSSSIKQATVRTAPTEPGSPVRSPRKRVRRSASRSPHRPPRSPRHCSPLRSPRKTTNTATGSPLKHSLQPQVLILPPSTVKRPREFDHAPFSHLIHVQQENTSEPLWTLTSAETGLKPRTLPAGSNFSLRPNHTPCLSSCDVIRENHTPLLTPVTSTEQRATILKEVARDHSQENVQCVFQRYRNIRGGVADHTPLDTPPTLSSEREKRTRRPLVCKIHILNGRRRERVKVDKRFYGGKKRSLQLRRKRSVSVAEISVEEGLTKGGGEGVKSEVGKEGGGGQGSCDMWSELYRPRSSSEVIGNKVKVQQLCSWLQSWSNKSVVQSDQSLGGRGGGTTELKRSGRSSREGSPTPEWARGGTDFMSLSHLRRRRRTTRRRLESSSCSETEEEEGSEGEGEGVSSVLLLCGGVGCGKTAAVHACAAELGCKVFEVNAGSVRSRGTLLATLKEATLSHQVSLQPSLNTTSSEKGVKLSTKEKTGSNGLLTFFKHAHGRGGGGEGGHCRPVSLESSTVILLEEVDVLFDSDRGFWSGVYDLITTTRRPIILTSNDSKLELECHRIKIVFDPPPLEELGMHIQLLCLSCDYHMTSDMAVRLADSLHVDIRRIFLFLQFWLSGHRPSPLTTIPGISHSYTSSSRLTPRLSLPWRTFKPHPLTSDLNREIDMASHEAEQHSYLDIVSTETTSCDSHMRSNDIIGRAWWRGEEEAGLMDELPERVCRWREEEVGRGVCEEVERRSGGRERLHHHDPVSWCKFTRHVQSVRHCLEQCSKVFALTSRPVGMLTDSLPLLRSICSSETNRQLTHTKRRFRHYLHQVVAVDQADLGSLPLTARFPSSQHK